MIRWFVMSAALGLGICLLAGFASPWSALADSFSHFRLYLTGLLALAAVVLAIMGAWWSAGLAFTVAAIGLAGLLPVLTSTPRDEAELSGRPTLTLVQLNLFYANEERSAAAFIEQVGADIVTLQEVNDRNRWILSALKSQYPYQFPCRYSRVGDVVIVSKFPPAPDTGSMCFRGDGLLWARFLIEGRAVSVASLHLPWPFPYPQWQRLDRITEDMKEIPRPVIVGGDFNAAPWSQSVKRVAKATDTELVGGLRFTFNRWGKPWGPLLVSLPIDHVLSGEGIRPVKALVGDDVGSDHRPVVVTFVLE